MCCALGLTPCASASAAPRPCAGSAAPGSLEIAVDKAAPAGTTVLGGPGLALVLGAEPLAAAACAPAGLAAAALTQAVLDAEAALGVDAALAVVLSSAPLACGNLYYVPLANDVRGIGYAHHDPREVFDDTPEHHLEGIAFLNDWPYWQTHLDELPSALNHEVGHRWGARVHARIDGVSSAALLGREQEHWSFFLSSAGSALGGNVWTETSSGYASETPLYPSAFSELDLYSMGVVPATDVPAQRLLSPRSAPRDCTGRPASASSPPQTCGGILLDATSVLISIDDVIEAEGPRAPAASLEPRRLDVLPLVLHSRAGAWSSTECETASLGLRETLAGFALATQGRLLLENVLDAGMSCAELSRASAAADAEASALAEAAPVPSCAVDAGRSRASSGAWVIVALAGVVRRRWSRRKR